MLRTAYNYFYYCSPGTVIQVDSTEKFPDLLTKLGNYNLSIAPCTWLCCGINEATEYTYSRYQ